MNITYDQLNFENVNSEKEFSWKTRTIVVLISLFFIFTPLYEISPEIFQTNEAVEVFFGCLGASIWY